MFSNIYGITIVVYDDKGNIIEPRKCSCSTCKEPSYETLPKPLCSGHAYLRKINKAYHEMERFAGSDLCSNMPISDRYMYLCSAYTLRKVAEKEYGSDAGHTYWSDKLLNEINIIEEKINTTEKLHIECKNIVKCIYCENYVVKSRAEIAIDDRFICNICNVCTCGQPFRIEYNEDDEEDSFSQTRTVKGIFIYICDYC